MASFYIFLALIFFSAAKLRNNISNDFMFRVAACQCQMIRIAQSAEAKFKLSGLNKRNQFKATARSMKWRMRFGSSSSSWYHNEMAKAQRARYTKCYVWSNALATLCLSWFFITARRNEKSLINIHIVFGIDTFRGDFSCFLLLCFRSLYRFFHTFSSISLIHRVAISPWR